MNRLLVVSGFFIAHVLACRPEAASAGAEVAAETPPEGAVAWSLRSTEGRYLLTLQRTELATLPEATLPEAPPTLEGTLFDFRQNRPAFGLALVDTLRDGQWIGEVYQFDEPGVAVTLDFETGGAPPSEISGTIGGEPVRFGVSPLPLGLVRRGREDVNAQYGDSVTGSYGIELLQLAATAPHSAGVNDSLWVQVGGALPRPADLAAAIDDSLAVWSEAHDLGLADAATESEDGSEPGLFAYNEAYEWSQRVLVADDTLLTVASTLYVYSGGAHGNYGTEYFSVDRRSGTAFALDTTAIDPARRQRLHAALDAAARRYLGQAPGSPLDESLFVAAVPLTDNVGRLPGGWLFGYPPYAIAAYALGQIELVVWDREWE